MGIVWPEHEAQPLGAKVYGKRAICPMKGSISTPVDGENPPDVILTRMAGRFAPKRRQVRLSPSPTSEVVAGEYHSSGAARVYAVDADVSPRKKRTRSISASRARWKDAPRALPSTYPT